MHDNYVLRTTYSGGAGEESTEGGEVGVNTLPAPPLGFLVAQRRGGARDGVCSVRHEVVVTLLIFRLQQLIERKHFDLFC